MQNWHLEHLQEEEEGDVGGDVFTARGQATARDGGEEDLKMERTVVTLVIKRLHTKESVLLYCQSGWRNARRPVASRAPTA